MEALIRRVAMGLGAGVTVGEMIQILRAEVPDEIVYLAIKAGQILVQHPPYVEEAVNDSAGLSEAGRGGGDAA